MKSGDDLKLFSDEIRRRERRSRRKEPMWGALSFAFHVVLFVVIVLCTPVKSLVFDEKKEKPNPAADLSAERIEQIADALSQARINELLRQLEALQAVLHNMDLMKEELQKDYDAFSEESAEDVKVALGKLIDQAEGFQKDAVSAQEPMVETVARLLAEERQDLDVESRARFLHDTAGQVTSVGTERINGAQASAGNAFDRIQTQASFAGYRKTAEAAGKVRDAQIEASTMQSNAQGEAADIAWKLGDYFYRHRDVTNLENSIAGQRKSMAWAESERDKARQERADAERKRDQAQRERDQAQQREREAREAAGRANAEAKSARDESGRLKGELNAARRQLEQAKKARDAAERAAKGGK